MSSKILSIVSICICIAIIVIAVNYADSRSPRDGREFAVIMAVLVAVCTVYYLLSLFRKVDGLIKPIAVAMIMAGIAMMIWSGVMYDSPSHISVDEVFFVWIIYAVAGILTSIKPALVSKSG